MAGRLMEIKSFLTGMVAILAERKFSIGKLYRKALFPSSKAKGVYVFSRKRTLAAVCFVWYNHGMENATDRLRILIGEAGLEKLKNAKVTLVGLGGVGGQAAEAVARSFVGRLVLIDGDRVAESNTNRQILAKADTVGKEKAVVAAERAKSINPLAQVSAIPLFLTKENVPTLDIWDSDCIVDAIDDVDAKVALITEAVKRGVPVYSSMGAANRLDPTAFKVADISEAHTCPLAKKVRKLLAAQGITKGLTVVFSTEKPLSFGGALGSNAFVPPAAGLALASAAVKDILARQ